MANLTLSIDDDVLHHGREYARVHGISLNALVRQLLERAVLPAQAGAVEELFGLMDGLRADSKGVTEGLNEGQTIRGVCMVRPFGGRS